MNDKINIQDIFKEIHDLFLETNDIEKTIEIYFNNESKEFKGIVDFSELKTLMLAQAKASKTIHSIYEKKENIEVLENTLNQFDYEFEDEQIEVFKELIKYDKAIIYDEDKIFYRLNTLLIKIFEHLGALEHLNDLDNEKDIIKKGIAKTTHPIVKDAVIPRIKTLKDYQQLNDSKESKLMVNLYEDFLKNPLEIRTMYSGLNTGNPKFTGENKELLDIILNQQTYLNSATIMEETHIFRSCQIYSFSYYKDTNLINKTLQLEENIEEENLIKYINILMNSFFDYVFDSKLKITHINKVIQLKDTFNNLDIVEFRTKRNYKEHPIFENI